MNKKIILNIAGANVSGKTTFAPYLHHIYDKEDSVKPDIIAAGLSLHPQTVAFQSGRLALKRIKKLINLNKSFAYETTLASHTVEHIMKSCDRRLFRINLHFLALPSIVSARNRVRLRVEQGGHDIPDSVIERRFKRGLNNFFSVYKHQVDEWVLYDALSTQEIIAYQSGSEPKTVLLPEKLATLESLYDQY